MSALFRVRVLAVSGTQVWCAAAGLLTAVTSGVLGAELTLRCGEASVVALDLRQLRLQSSVDGISPDAACQAVSRPGDMGRWSPENLGTTSGPDGNAMLGSTFVGRNKRGRFRWVTRCTVTAADPGERFAFRVHAIGRSRPQLRCPIATWEYRFEPAGKGTRVTETWTDERRSWPTFVANTLDWLATSGRTFVDFQARDIDRTLRNLKRELEQDHAV